MLAPVRWTRALADGGHDGAQLLVLWAALLSINLRSGVEGQVFQYTEITLSQYDAQKHYEGWQKSDDIYDKFQWDEGYAECADDPQGYLAAGSVWNCDTMADILGCSYGNLTEIFGEVSAAHGASASTAKH
eukprot:SAG11_NODE_2070_length_3864_cov_1.772112_4_plen_131_part_00